VSRSGDELIWNGRHVITTTMAADRYHFPSMEAVRKAFARADLQPIAALDRRTDLYDLAAADEAMRRRTRLGVVLPAQGREA
jgi:hypothetical protein